MCGLDRILMRRKELRFDEQIMLCIKKKSDFRKRLMVIFLLLAFLFWIVFVATVPKTRTGEIRIEDRNGRRHSLLRWQARPLVQLPFFDTEYTYVQIERKIYFIHGRMFGWSLGNVLLSPEKTKILIGRRFEGLERAFLLVDLDTGERVRVTGYVKAFQDAGWVSIPWGLPSRAVQ